MVQIRDASDLSANDLAEVMERCFEDYVIPLHFTVNLSAYLLRVEAVDLLATRIATVGESVVGVLLVTRRGDLMRVGALAVAKDYRGQGIGSRLLDQAITEGRSRGEKRSSLEAIEHNTAAIRFYERVGFRIRFRLVSAESEMHCPETGLLSRTTFEEMAARLIPRSDAAWSWGMSPASIQQFCHPIEAFEYDGLYFAVQPLAENTLLCRGLALSASQDSEKLRAALGDFARLYPDRTFRLPPAFPEPEYGEVLLGAGFTFGQLSQVQMERML